MSPSNSIFDKIKEAKQMLDVGNVSEEGFTEIKEEDGIDYSNILRQMEKRRVEKGKCKS